VDLGICKYKPDAGPLARRLRASWAHWFADLSGGDLPDDTALFASCAEHGLRPVPNLRTSIAALRRFGAEGGMDGAIQWYSDCILRYCDTYPVRDIEVWGDADIAFIAGGKANPLDYGRVLTAVYWRVKSARPDVTIWTGGFGADFAVNFVDDGVARHAPEAFDVCNLHPFASLNPPDPGPYRATAAIRIDRMRRTLDKKAKGQPFASTGFGLPTVPFDGPPPQAFGRYWRVAQGACAPLEHEALAWYVTLLELMRDCGFLTVCLLLDDFSDGQVPRFQQWCGLRREDGTEKAFVEGLCDWGHTNAERKT